MEFCRSGAPSTRADTKGISIMKARYEVLNLGSRDGLAMAATLGVLSLLSVLVVTVFANAMASFRPGMTDLEKSRTYYAAGAESGMAQLALALEDAVIEDQELSAIIPPVVEGFSFEEFSVVTAAVSHQRGELTAPLKTT
jgi:hypothetical protein